MAAESQTKTVLIVDDELLFLRTVAHGFAGSAGIEALTAHNGRIAMEILGRTRVDLVVTDLNMPEVDGFELLAYLSREHPDMPVIVMTAFATPELEARLRSYGVSQYLEKPLGWKELEARVLEVLQASVHGHLEGITLATFLQMIAMERKTCTVTASTGERTGRLQFQAGDLVHAEAGELTGEAAAMEIVCWPRPAIEFDARYHPHERTVRMPLAEILLEAFRIQDESARGVGAAGGGSHSDYLALGGPAAPGAPPAAISPAAETTISTAIPTTTTTTTTEETNMAGAAQEKMKELASSIDGFMGAALYTPAGELLAHYGSDVSNLKDVGVLANNVLMNAQKASLEMGTGRGQQVHVEGERSQILARCLNEGTDPLRSQPGKAHIHMVMVLKSDAPIGLAKLRMNSAIAQLADDFRG